MKSFLLYRTACQLGEGPLWHPLRKSCFWVDIEGRSLYEYRWPGSKLRCWKMESRISAVVRHQQNELILAMQGGLARFNPDTGQLHTLLDLEKQMINNRCNDAACDSEGRLWVGTMDLKCREGAGALYCIDKDLTVEKKLDNITISNGLGWSPDNKRMYHIDSAAYTVKSYWFDAATGNIVFEKDAIVIPAHLGMPDGMAVDRHGMLWIAHWGGYGVFQWDPHSGMLLDKINVPAPHVTSCAFFGKSMDQLLITTAREGMSPADLAEFPESGNIFIAKTDVKGMVRNACRIPLKRTATVKKMFG